jgi:hypothetical protein
MVQLENLRVVANAATIAINARAPLLINRLRDIPARVQEIALHDICHGVAVALVAMQVQTRHDLVSMEPVFPMANDPDMHEDLIEEFDEAAAKIVDIILA